MNEKKQGTKVIDIKPGEPPAADAAELAKLGDAGTAIAPAQETQIVAAGMANFGDVPTALPSERIHLAFAVGTNRPDSANQGELWLGKKWDLKIMNHGGNVEIVVLGMNTYWREWPRSYTPGVVPRRFATRDEAVRAGMVPRVAGTFNPASNCAEACDVLCLVKRPEIVPEGNEHFLLPFGGEYYAPAIVAFDKGAFADAQAALKRVYTYDAILHKDVKGYVPVFTNTVFRLSAPERQTSKGKIPFLTLSTFVRPGEKTLAVTSDAFRKDIEAFLKGKTVDVPSDAE